MKKFVHIGLLSAGLGCVALTVGAADLKIATINFQKAYEAYYKSIQSALAIKRDVADVKKEEAQRIEIEKKHEEEYRDLVAKSTDQALPAEQREKNANAAADKRAELKVDEQSLSEFDQRAKMHIQTEDARRTADIIKEIRGVVEARAKAGGFNFVLDSSGESAYHVPVLLYANGQEDLTEAIIKELNAAAPPGSLDTNALAEPMTNNLTIPGSTRK